LRPGKAPERRKTTVPIRDYIHHMDSIGSTSTACYYKVNKP
jgi:hypothetical protein